MKKHALHFGLDNTSYTMEEGELTANSPVANVSGYHKLASDMNFDSSDLVTNERAVSWRLFRKLRVLSKKMKAGDLLFLTYSGHGYSIKSQARTEPDGATELFMMYDRVMMDIEIRRCLTWFNPGVFIFFLTNSCRNGTVIDIPFENYPWKATVAFSDTDPPIQHEAEDDISENQLVSYLNAIKYYVGHVPKPSCPIIHIASSRDTEDSWDSENENEPTPFTQTFLELAQSKSPQSYMEFFNKLSKIQPDAHKESNRRSPITDDFWDSPFLGVPTTQEEQITFKNEIMSTPTATLSTNNGTQYIVVDSYIDNVMNPTDFSFRDYMIIEKDGYKAIVLNFSNEDPLHPCLKGMADGGTIHLHADVDNTDIKWAVGDQFRLMYFNEQSATVFQNARPYFEARLGVFKDKDNVPLREYKTFTKAWNFINGDNIDKQCRGWLIPKQTKKDDLLSIS